MTTVIGLPSGKEFVVQDGSFVFTDDRTGITVRVFESADGKRLITVPPAGESVEFYDEPNSEEGMKSLQNASRLIPEVKQDYDVSIV